MTIFAGIVARGRAQRPFPGAWIAHLRRNISRDPRDAPQLIEGPDYAVTWLDLHQDPEPSARVDDAGNVTLIAGDPILGWKADDEPSRSELDRLHDDFRNRRHDSLRRARGAFCAAHFDPMRRRLCLAGDRLGLRPIYYSVQPEYVVFATALRILEGARLVVRQGDLRALAESACFGYPLGPRSPIAHVRSLEAAQVVEVLPETSSSDTYWSWDDLEPTPTSEDGMCRQLSAAFRDAVAVRLDTRRHAVALLSGGLDSRCVVSALRSMDAEVDTIGFGPEGTADEALSRQVASGLQTRHFELRDGTPEFWPRMASAYTKWRQQSSADVCRSVGCELWSGEGGDRVLAPVNLSASVVAAMRHGDVERAIETYMRDEHAALPVRLFRKRMRQALNGLPQAGMREELGRRTSSDPARRFHIYVLVNEARRNIYRHFEDIDLNRYELVMPFYDAEFVRLVLSFPIDPFIAHGFYYRWLREFPVQVHAIPWQAYPTSIPCPLPLPGGLRSQWDHWFTAQQQKTLWKQQQSLADSIVNAREFPDWLLNRTLLRCARLLHRLGFRRYGYIFEAARPFVKYPPPSPSATAG